MTKLTHEQSASIMKAFDCYFRLMDRIGNDTVAKVKSDFDISADIDDLEKSILTTFFKRKTEAENGN